MTNAAATDPSPYAAWSNGPSSDPQVFPIGVWLQNPDHASEYKQAGINFFMGLWQGPTEAQLATLRRYGMRVIAEQNAVGLAHRDDPIIMGWMQQDEPDNAQPRPGGGYGPPVVPSEIQGRYERMKNADPTRPVYLGLGQGVANDEWRGRGPGASPLDYPQYCRGGDIVGFDVYPVAGIDKPNGADYLWLVAKGLDRLREWCGPDKVIWNVIEASNISSTHQVTPQQLRAEVWMSIVHGSRGIVYFVHRFKPSFDEAHLLHEPELLAAVTGVNTQIEALAPVLNSPTVQGAAHVSSAEPSVPVDALVKRLGDATYVFAVGMRNAPTVATVTLAGVADGAQVRVIGEGRSLTLTDGRFTDDFAPYDVHLYEVTPATAGPK